MSNSFNSLEKRIQLLLEKSSDFVDPEMRSLLDEVVIYHSELEHQNEEMAEILRSYTNLYDCAPVPYMVLDTNRVILRVNDAFSRLFGYDKLKIPGTLVFDCIPKIFENNFNRFLRLMVQGFPNSIELKFLCQNFNEIFVKVDGFQPIGSTEIFITLTDITMPKKLEVQLLRGRELDNKKLQDATNIWDAVINTLPVFFFAKEIDYNYRYILANQAWQNLLGLNENELIGKTDFDLFDTEFATYLRKADEFVQNENDIRFSIENRIGNDKKEHIIQIFRKVFMTADNRRLLLSSGVDITELDNAKAIVEQINCAKSSFLASVSHEIRTPLNAIIGFTELLQDTEISPELRQEYLTGIKMSGNTMLHFINNILDYSILESKQMHFKCEFVDIGVLCQELTTPFIQYVKNKNINWEMNIPELPMIFTDKLRLRQVLFSILNNALKFTSSGFIKLNVSWECVSSQCGNLKFDIMDTGIGISKARMAQIFAPFAQSEALHGTGSNYKAVGLSLAVSKLILDNMNGVITVDSQLNQGSQFTVLLKNVSYNCEQSKSSVSQELTATEPNSICTCLLVDDVIGNLRITQAMLNKIGIKAIAAESATQAIEILKRQKVDLIMTDLWMPNINGAELVQTIRTMSENKEIPTIAITADTEYEQNFNMRLFNDVITKPITVEKIQELINRLYLK